MIFVTLGTHEQPFERALDLVSELAGRGEDMVVQHGTTPARDTYTCTRWCEYLDWESLTSMMREAEVVITHGGVGSTVTAIRSGKTPIMVPRLARFGEHVDDHQLQLAERFADRGLALVHRPGADVAELVTNARGSRPTTTPANRVQDLRGAVVAAAGID